MLEEARRIGEQRLVVADVGGFVVLESVLVEVVAKSDEPHVFAVVTGPEERHGLGHEPAQARERRLAHREIAGRIGGDADAGAARALGKGHGPEVLAGQDWRIDERRERDDREEKRVALDPLRMERAIELPPGGQVHLGSDRNRIRRGIVRIENEVVERQDEEVRRHVRRAAVAVRKRLGRRQIIEAHVEHRSSPRHLDPEQKRIERIAPPRERGAAGADLERDQLGDRAVRRMLAGDPFRIGEGQRPRMDRDHEMRVLDRPRDVTGIDLERDGGRRGHARGGGEQGERRKGWLEVSQAH